MKKTAEARRAEMDFRRSQFFSDNRCILLDFDDYPVGLDDQIDRLKYHRSIERRAKGAE